MEEKLTHYEVLNKELEKEKVRDAMQFNKTKKIMIEEAESLKKNIHDLIDEKKKKEI